jgi:hypothetical protein
VFDGSGLPVAVQRGCRRRGAHCPRTWSAAGRRAYIVTGATGSIDHNVFLNNGNGVVTESVSVTIFENSFQGSVGADVALLSFVNANRDCLI